MVIKKYKNLILPIKVESSKILIKHKKGPGKRYVFSDNKNNPSGNIYSILRAVENIKNSNPHIETHIHSCNSLWMFMGNKENLKGLKVEVILGDEKYILDSPASIYIPQGVKHNYKFIKGSGKYINIVLAKGGEYNKVTK